MKKLERYTKEMNLSKEYKNLWCELLQLREKILCSEMKDVTVMFDVALDALILERKRMDKKSANEQLHRF